MKNLSLIAALLIAAPTLAVADDRATNADANAKLSDSDIAVVTELHHANQSEVDMGKFALSHGTKAVKDYATMMVKDHSANDAKLVALAKKHGIAKIPAPPADKSEMDDMTKLKAMKGSDFDRAYVDAMVADHEKDITTVADAINSVSDTDLRDHLVDTKPVLEHHLENAKALQSAPAQAQR